jgi:hypothetical protein
VERDHLIGYLSVGDGDDLGRILEPGGESVDLGVLRGDGLGKDGLDDGP